MRGPGAQRAVIAPADFPDDASLVALELAVNATGRVNSTTVKLITPEDVDKASKKAVTYQAPGG